MNKQIISLSLIFLSATGFSANSLAGQCRIDIKNQVTLDGEKLEITHSDGDSAVVDGDNNLFIGGDKIQLTADQQAAIEQYRQQMNDYLPRAKQLADDGVALANDLIDDVATSLEAPGAFDDVKTAVKDFYADVEARYYKDGDLILPAQSFDEMTQSWANDFAKAKEIFTSEFLSDAMGVLSEKMQQDGGLNLTELSEGMYALKERVEKRMAEHAAESQQKAQEFCESLDQMAEQEQDVLKKIPQLKDYQVFSI
ncbi:methyl-accepting chemotaxis protein [Vibrio ichthyoenteri ATCC 700023]|uniref:Methyl-accepting chemotaxis protein n=1 Tax=Vibrio ichthyoenteri ATCC 700023 TaxID=870968 RepID=F9S0T8_9VIBR|nr:YggN family protein [Vibrio ichthyoenteri]EGU42921.1 methyl-accepting chemotaxis protein [Vibrio ichthyoenteri ATCC 700023]